MTKQANGAEPEERELKFLCEDLSDLRERLVDADAERISASSKEVNWVLDRAGELEQEGRLLRVRLQAGGATLTFKGPARFEGAAKIRTEREAGVDDHEEVLAILRSLGYEVSRLYEKFRETWRLGGVLVCLDHTPIGDFVEFEGARAEQVATRFRFSAAQVEPRNYLALYEDYRLSHPEVPEDMVFP